MKKRIQVMMIASVLLVLFSGCHRAQQLLHDSVDAPLAPTSIPIATAVPTANPTSSPEASLMPQATAADTAQPPASTSTPEATAPADQPPATTRVIRPQDVVNLPPGFGISVYAQGLRDPRMMAVGPDDALYVAERGAGRIIRLPDSDQDGIADGIETVADNLSAPSSLAFTTDGTIYVGETTRILRLRDPDSDGIYQQRDVVIDGLPSGGHNTRTVLFSPDETYLYVSIGSSCNVCEEDDPRRATIVRYRPDGSEEFIYATGLRNAVGITFRPGTEELWATNNGRDWLGDDHPPETVYLVREGDDAGWPRCHAGRIEDPDFGGPGACDDVIAPVVEMQAHSAPLGLTFYSGTQFPQDYQGDLFVAFHGSWNRTEPTGYKVVHIPIEDGTAGAVRDFATGWLRSDGTQWGRPVDVITGSDGGLYISDDGGDRIYRVFYVGE